jgi:hypothetical protein
MASDSRYTVEVSLCVKEEKPNGESTDFFSECVKYSDMDYGRLVTVEAALHKLQEMLLGFGIEQAKLMGFGEALKQAGIIVGKKD